MTLLIYIENVMMYNMYNVIVIVKKIIMNVFVLPINIVNFVKKILF